MKMNKYVSQYVSASDLEKPWLVVIDQVTEEDVGNDRKPVLYGEDARHVFVLNPTNISQLTQLLKSDDSDQWLGKMIVAYNDRSVMFGGKRVGGIRFRLPKEGTTRPPRPEVRRVTPGSPADAEGSDDVPF